LIAHKQNRNQPECKGGHIKVTLIQKFQNESLIQVKLQINTGTTNYYEPKEKNALQNIRPTFHNHHSENNLQ